MAHQSLVDAIYWTISVACYRSHARIIGIICDVQLCKCMTTRRGAKAVEAVMREGTPGRDNRQADGVDGGN